MNELKIKISHLKKSYGRPILKDINLEVDNSSYFTIVGKSGSGKSTLLNILGLIESFDAGEYVFNGTLIRNYNDHARLRRENIGFIFQSYDLIPTLTCRENILLPSLYSKKYEKKSLDELAGLLDITHLLEQNVTTLSGGEKQRVAVARALILDPCLLLADEPTGNLDPKNSGIIFDLLSSEHKKGRAVILITHDQSLASRSETVLSLENGVLEKDRSFCS